MKETDFMPIYRPKVAVWADEVGEDELPVGWITDPAEEAAAEDQDPREVVERGP